MKFLIGTQSEKKETWIKWRRVINLNVTLWIVFFRTGNLFKPSSPFLRQTIFHKCPSRGNNTRTASSSSSHRHNFFGNLEQNLISPKLKFSISLLQYFSLVRIKLASQINIFFSLVFFQRTKWFFTRREKSTRLYFSSLLVFSCYVY